MKRYQIAMYIRLSKEDDRCREESNSITMQRNLLQRYVKENFSDYDLYEFCDDGYTGTNFDRPGIQSMLEKVRNGKIDCIIVKDFSRFARDYIELGSYLEQIFPFLGVRFISLNDRYDSINYQWSIADIDVNFKNLLYDLYSKDLSEKVRSSLAVRKEQGQYVSGNSPFGYEKDPKDRHGLLIAEDEAEVIRRIYALTVEGYSSVEIARLFQKEHVKTPIEFKIEKGKTSRIPKGDRFSWSSSTICRILRNEVYIGNIVQKKYEKDFVGGKNHMRPREEWMIGCNHHEPIIDKKVFDQVQEGRGRKRKPKHEETHPLTGKLVCGCCKKNLCFRKGRNPYFFCHYRYSNRMEDCVDKVNAMFLERSILFRMQEKLQADGELAKLRMDTVSRLRQEMKERKEKRSVLSAKIQKIKKQNFEAYRDYVYGRTDSFRSDESMMRSVMDELDQLDKDIQKMEAAYTKTECEKDSLSSVSQFFVLTKGMIDRYIDKIIVYDEKNIEIFLKKREA